MKANCLKVKGKTHSTVITIPRVSSKLFDYQHSEVVESVHKVLSKKVIPGSKTVNNDHTVLIILQLNSSPDLESRKHRKNEIDLLMSGLFEAGFKSVPEGTMTKYAYIVGDINLSLQNPDMDRPERIIALRKVNEQSNMIVWNPSNHSWQVTVMDLGNLPGNTVMFMAQAPVVKRFRFKDLDPEF